MNVSLTPELDKFIEERLNAGRYRSASEVIREGLRLLADREELRKLKLKKLEEELELGLKSGPGAPMTEGDWDSLRSIARKASKKKGR